MLDFPLRYTPETPPISMANIDMAQFAERANATHTAIVVSGCLGHRIIGIYTGIATDHAFPHIIVIGLPPIIFKVCRQCWKRHGSLKAIAYVAQS